MSIELTKDYIEYFNNKDLVGLRNLLCDKVVLEDPVVKRVEGIDNVLFEINNIFKSCNILSFKAKNIYQDHNITIVEFILKIDNNTLKGVDIIEWKDSKIKQLRAYLDIPKD